MEIDNNLVEPRLRLLAPGRWNYLFAGSHEAAQWAAVVCSLLGTCKLHGVNPGSGLRPYSGAFPRILQGWRETLAAPFVRGSAGGPRTCLEAACRPAKLARQGYLPQNAGIGPVTLQYGPACT